MHTSIIIPSYNNLSLIYQCIKSIRKSRSTISHDIIIIDNASSKETLEYLQYLHKYSPIRILFNKSNLGFAKACNQGAKIAKGEHLIFLNNDTEVSHGWVEGLASCIRADHRIGVVGCKLLYPDNTIQHAGVAFSSVKVHHLYRNFHPEHPATNKFRELQAVTGACMLVARKLFLSLGGFDEAFINGFEDLDFCFRARSKGAKVVYTPESVIIHHEGKTPGRHAHHAHNARLFATRWLPSVVHDLDRLYEEDGLRRIVEPDTGLPGRWIEDMNQNPYLEKARALAGEGQTTEAARAYYQALAFNPFDIRRSMIENELLECHSETILSQNSINHVDAIAEPQDAIRYQHPTDHEMPGRKESLRNMATRSSRSRENRSIASSIQYFRQETSSRHFMPKMDELSCKKR